MITKYIMHEPEFGILDNVSKTYAARKLYTSRKGGVYKTGGVRGTNAVKSLFVGNAHA